MFDRSIPHDMVTLFGGPMLLLDSTDAAPEQGLLARNVDYLDGQVKSRLGFKNVFNVGAGVSAMTAWPGAPPGNSLVWFRPDIEELFCSEVSALSAFTLGAIADAVGFIGAAAATRMYVTGFDAAQRGVTDSNYVISHDTLFLLDQAFLGPVAFGTSGVAESGSGRVTAGLHNLGFVIEYRSGFRTRPSPDTSGADPVSLSTFAPVAFTSTGGQNLEWTVNPGSDTWPAEAVAIHFIMSTFRNQADFYFVPDLRVPVSGGTNTPAVGTINISDEELVAYGQPANAQLLLLTKNTNGDNYFEAYHVSFYGDRAVWLTQLPDSLDNPFSVAFYTPTGRYEEVTADQNLITLPGNRAITCHFALRDVSYLLGPTWTYKTEDNGGVPATWATPQLVDGRRGTLSIRGVEVAPTGDHAWVVDQTGLYVFNGAYSDLPISYWQTPDWNRINWDAAHTIQVKDVPGKRQVQVLVPLDGASTPTHLMTWNYEKGKTFNKARYSLNSFLNYDPGAIEMVQNTLPAQAPDLEIKSDLWVAPSDVDYMIRAVSQTNEATPFNDQATPIRATYETGMFPRGGFGPIYRHIGGTARVTGATSVMMSVYGMDRTKVAVAQGIPLSNHPGLEVTRLVSLLSEGASVRMDSNIVPNGDFEYGGYTWEPGSGWAINSDPVNARGGRYVAVKTPVVSLNSRLVNERRIAAAAGDIIYVEYWFKTAGGTDGALGVGIIFYDANGVEVGTQTLLAIGTPTTYTRMAAQLGAAPAGTAYAVAGAVSVFQTAGAWYIDDLVMIPMGSNWLWAQHTHYFSEWATRR